ncbi:MAG: undecaprenyl-diphosphate phosphatase, partial [Burkholderiales bacterium]
LLDFNDERGKVFEIVIQLGAILAVCWEYREKIFTVTSTLSTSPASKRFIINLMIAFTPAAVLGLIFIKKIKEYLFNPEAVAIAFIVGGIMILWAERRKHRIRVEAVDEMGWQDALKIGMAQSFALIPGTSRSGATIIGGLFFGLNRKSATEFSFFLAIPTMFAATFYDLYKNWGILHAGDFDVFAVGFVSAFISAFFAVRGLLRYISSHDFTLFAWYRVIFGIVLLGAAHFGLVKW